MSLLNQDVKLVEGIVLSKIIQRNPVKPKAKNQIRNPLIAVPLGLDGKILRMFMLIKLPAMIKLKKTDAIKC